MKSELVFQQLFESQSSTYTYLLADAETKEAVLIDTVLETVDRDLKLVGELGLKLKFVLDTHIHADHVTGAGEIRSRVGVQTAVSARANVQCADLRLSDGQELEFGRFKIKVLETPGHTDSCLSFQCEDMVFSGDALLIRGTGRTDFQNGSSEKLYESVTQKLFRLPLEARVFPAHDYKGFTSSTIGDEIKNNPRVGSGKTVEQFTKIMSELKLDKPKRIHEALPANQACGRTEAPSIAPGELANRDSETLIVDVRTSDEFGGAAGHIPKAHHITLGDDLKNFLASYDRKGKIVFVCQAGTRSQEAAKLAMGMGFQNVASLQGGMQKWLDAGFPVHRPSC